VGLWMDFTTSGETPPSLACLGSGLDIRPFFLQTDVRGFRKPAPAPPPDPKLELSEGVCGLLARRAQ